MNDKSIFAVAGAIAVLSITGLVINWDNEQAKFLLALASLISTSYSVASLVRIFKK